MKELEKIKGISNRRKKKRNRVKKKRTQNTFTSHCTVVGRGQMHFFLPRCVVERVERKMLANMERHVANHIRSTEI